MQTSARGAVTASWPVPSLTKWLSVAGNNSLSRPCRLFPDGAGWPIRLTKSSDLISMIVFLAGCT